MIRRTLLITGVTGVLGSALAKELLNQGNNVIGTGRKTCGLLDKETRDNRRFTYIKGALSNNIRERLKKKNIRGIFHLASLLNYSPTFGFNDFFKGNVDTTKAVIDIAKDHEVEFVIHSSTCSVYGKNPPEKYINENTNPIPLDNYGLSKFIAERLLEIELMSTPIKVLVFRFPSLFGKQDRTGIVKTFFELSKKNEEIELFSKGERFRNLLDIEDAVKIMRKGMYRVPSLGKHEVFVATSSKSLQMKEIVKIIVEHGSSQSKVTLSNRTSPNDFDSHFDNKKLLNLLQYKPKNMRQSLKQYLGTN